MYLVTLKEWLNPNLLWGANYHEMNKFLPFSSAWASTTAVKSSSLWDKSAISPIKETLNSLWMKHQITFAFKIQWRAVFTKTGKRAKFYEAELFKQYFFCIPELHFIQWIKKVMNIKVVLHIQSYFSITFKFKLWKAREPILSANILTIGTKLN